MKEEKEELVDEILRLRREIKDLNREVKDLNKELGRLKEKSHPPEKYPPKQANSKKAKPPEQWGRPKGHAGCARAKPEQVDREVEQKLEYCPECHGKLSESQEVMEHLQEDIVPSRVEVTRYKRHRYWCRKCRKTVTAPYGEGEVPYGYLGPLALTHMVLLKYYYGLPGNKIVKLFEVFCGLKVSEGAIAQALQRMAQYLNIEARSILEAIHESPYIHVDETGWKINGSKHWLWAFVNEKLAYYRIDKSRGSKIPKEVLGNPFPGILISDFYSAYNLMNCRQQKCLVHLLREMHRCRGIDPPKEDMEAYKKLKRILKDAQRLQQQREQLPEFVFTRRAQKLKKRLFYFTSEVYEHPHWKRLASRCLKHEDNLLTFLDVPGLPSHNNHAESMIRHHVILRNRSFQNRTEHGAYAQDTLSSILHTLLLQNKSAISAFSQAYLAHRQGVTQPLLFNSSPASISC